MVHPHARGEDAVLNILTKDLIGSPPRTWGRPFFHHWTNNRFWFTPTHVGKTSSSMESGKSNPVHPHARGEDSLDSGGTAVKYGSPPHTWGRL